MKDELKPEPTAESAEPTYLITNGSQQHQYHTEIDRYLLGKDMEADCSVCHPQPKLVGSMFGEEVYMLPSAHQKLTSMGIFDQSKSLEDYAGNPDLVVLLATAKAEGRREGAEQFAEKLKRTDILAGLPAEATTVVLLEDIEAALTALKGDTPDEA